MESDILSPEKIKEEAQVENELRPNRLEDFTGQSQIAEAINIFIKAALQRRDTLDHILFSGPPGLGKTTLALIIAKEMGVSYRITSGPALERPGDLAAILTSLNSGDVLFIDEVHRLSRTVEEVLYPAMEDYAIDLVIGKGPSARTIRLEVPEFCMIAATTRAGLLTSPLRDRFGYVARLGFYSVDELKKIVLRSSSILDISLTKKASYEIARRSRGTPRIANRLLKRVRDYAQVRHSGNITGDICKEALEFLRVDNAGLDEIDRKILEVLIHHYKGKPVGINAIASAIGEDPQTIEDVYEPFLIQTGFVARTPRGRKATEKSFNHLNVDVEGDDFPDKLF